MKKERFTKFIVCVCLSLFAINISAQENPVALLDLSDPNSWRYETNANETNMISVVETAEMPEGIGVQTENILKFESYDIGWGEWWWCGAIAINSPQEISSDKYNLKFKIYSPYSTMIHIILKSDPSTEITVLETVPLEPGEWNTLEMNLSDYVGKEIERMEIVPHYAAQTFYIYPYFEDPSVPVKAKGKVIELEEMDNANFEYGTNMEGTTSVSIIDTPDFLPELPVETDKLFKITTESIPWEFWYNAVIKLEDSKQIKSDRVLVAQVYSPADRVHVLLKGDDLALLNTTFNYGERKINPDEWNEIVLDFKSYHEETSFLEFIEICPTMPGIDIYVYFYWVEDDPDSVVADQLQENNALQVKDGFIHVENAKQIKLYNTAGQLLNISTNGAVKAIEGVNIVVADGKGYKVYCKNVN